MAFKTKHFQSNLHISFFLALLCIFSSQAHGYKVLDENNKRKLRVKIDYSENPNQSTFFKTSNSNLKQYIDIGLGKNIGGLWQGIYSVNKSSVFWTNPIVESKIINSIHPGPYTIGFTFNLTNDLLSNIEISQEDVSYGSVNIEAPNDKQINYWSKAKTNDWLEIIRGKIFRVNEKELFTVFQTTVYEGMTPIYAFRGETILRKL